MLAALLLALVGGIVLLALARAWAAEEPMDRKLVQRLIDLAVQDQPAAMRLLREHPELLAARYLHDETPLHFCAVEGLPEGVRFLAGAGMPVDARNEFGDTPLVDTVTLGNVEITRLLLRHGADPDASSLTRGRVLQIAAEQGNAALVAALLDAGARADYVTPQGENIWDAVERAPSRRDEVTKVLEGHGVARGGAPLPGAG
jgi:ankyrin repeat protein